MKNVLILGAGGQIARHVINQLADKQTIKQTLFARQPGSDSNLLIVLYVQIMPDDLVMQLHRF